MTVTAPSQSQIVGNRSGPCSNTCRHFKADVQPSLFLTKKIQLGLDRIAKLWLTGEQLHGSTDELEAVTGILLLGCRIQRFDSVKEDMIEPHIADATPAPVTL